MIDCPSDYICAVNYDCQRDHRSPVSENCTFPDRLPGRSMEYTKMRNARIVSEFKYAKCIFGLGAPRFSAAHVVQMTKPPRRNRSKPPQPFQDLSAPQQTLRACSERHSRYVKRTTFCASNPLFVQKIGRGQTLPAREKLLCSSSMMRTIEIHVSTLGYDHMCQTQVRRKFARHDQVRNG